MNRVNNISISICKESEPTKRGYERLKSVKRIVHVDGLKVYEDEMSPEMFCSCQDPIRKLEEYLLGLKETDCRKDITNDAGKHGGFFRKIWAELFRKKV